MAAVNEGVGTPLEAALKAGLDALDYNQTVTFTLYIRLILPLDGYAFWVKAALVEQGSLRDRLGLTATDPLPAFSVQQQGALHYASEVRQQEDSTTAVNRMIFTSKDEIQDFKVIDPDTLYIADFDDVRFAFSSRGSYFKQANLHHYFGVNLDPTMWDMVIDDPADMPPLDQVIANNSLPIWLYMNNYAPGWQVLFPFPDIPLYPSFLSPLNLTPPYGTVHIDPEGTTSYQMAPTIDSMSNSQLLAHDRVVITLYGANNRMAFDFMDAVNQFTLDTNAMGIVGALPIVRDDKKTQAEMMIIGEKKRIVYEVSYNQYTARNIARQLIEHVIVTLYAGDVQVSP